jgi:zinc protease
VRLDSNAKIADFIAQAWFYELGMNYADTYIQRVNAVTLADVQRVAQAYLHPDRFIEVVVTDNKDGAPPRP